VADRLDRAVGGTDLRVTRPRWWTAAGLVQRLLAAAAVVGALWLFVLGILGWLRLDDAITTPKLGDVPIPTLLLVGGVLAGILFAFMARVANGIGARRRSRKAARSLRRQVEEVAQELVIDPVVVELEAHERLRKLLTEAGART
jgi:hypothetical protein